MTDREHPAVRFWLLLAAGLGVVAAGLGAAHHMESHGHVVTGMDNQVVWGLPHVFAIFLIVAASGVLNVASVGSVFGQAPYKTRAPLAALLCLAMLAGGLMVLMLDLGRPERVVVAATHFNFTSMFAWNVFLYSGMAALVVVYLWTMAERRYAHHAGAVGVAVLVWRFVLTSGTGSIFGFLVARPAYSSALLAPLFIVLSLAWGMAVFLLVQRAVASWTGRPTPPALLQRMGRLLAIFVAASLYLVAVQHLTHAYFARQLAFESFIVLGANGGRTFAALFWAGYVGLGSVLPMALLWSRRAGSAGVQTFASLLVVAGAFAWLFVFIIGGQSFPLEIFPGHEVSSRFGDGSVAAYAPTMAEALLGIGGVAAAFVITLTGLRVLDVAPREETP